MWPNFINGKQLLQFIADHTDLIVKETQSSLSDNEYFALKRISKIAKRHAKPTSLNEWSAGK